MYCKLNKEINLHTNIQLIVKIIIIFEYYEL